MNSQVTLLDLRFCLVLVALASCSTGGDQFDQFKNDLVVLKQVCEKYGAGDKVYRTVGNVRGIFRINATEPYPKMGDQFGLADPWLVNDFPDGPNTMPHKEGGRQIMYWFSEAPPIAGSPQGSPNRRFTLTPGNKRPPANNLIDDYYYVDAEGFMPGSKWINARALASEYGFKVESLTTPEMRKHWIAGARLKIIKLDTQELLAERIDFFRAFGPRVQDAWASAVGCAIPSSGYDVSKFIVVNSKEFVWTVLKPPIERPDRNILKNLMEENYGK